MSKDAENPVYSLIYPNRTFILNKLDTPVPGWALRARMQSALAQEADFLQGGPILHKTNGNRFECVEWLQFNEQLINIIN